MAFTFVATRSQVTAKRIDLAAFTGTLTWQTDFPAGYQQNPDQCFMVDSVYMRLATSAVAATRRAKVSIADAAGVSLYQSVSRTSHPASTTIQYYFVPGVSFGTPLIGTVDTDPWSPLLVMHPGFVLTVDVSTGQAGDIVNQVVVQGHVINP